MQGVMLHSSSSWFLHSHQMFLFIGKKSRNKEYCGWTGVNTLYYCQNEMKQLPTNHGLSASLQCNDLDLFGSKVLGQTY